MEYITIEGLLFFLFYSIIIGLTLDTMSVLIKERNFEYFMETILIIAISLLIAIITPLIIGTMKQEVYFNRDINIVLGLASIGAGACMTKFMWSMYASVLGKDKFSDMTQIKKISRGHHKTRVKNYSSHIIEEELIEQIQNLIGKSNIEVRVTNDTEIDAGVYIDENNRRHTIELSIGCLKIPWEETAALIGHELIHIQLLNGSKKDKHRTIIGGIVLFTTMVLSLFIIYICETYFGIIGIFLSIGFTIISVITFLYWIFYFQIDKERYWNQIYELMCDRKACELDGVTVDGMKNVLERLYNEYKHVKEFKWYYRFYCKYFVVLEHPCLKYRVKQIKNYKKWGFIDYFKHPIIIVYWLLTGRGWTGD